MKWPWTVPDRERRVEARNAWLATVALPLVLIGCTDAPRGEPRLETFPLQGVVQVDGAPAEHLTVECYPQNTGELTRELAGVTTAEGKFSLGTYEAGDGVPEGEYQIAFKWLKKGKGLRGLQDALNGRYANPNSSGFSITVKKGEPADLGTIELTTK